MNENNMKLTPETKLFDAMAHRCTIGELALALLEAMKQQSPTIKYESVTLFDRVTNVMLELGIPAHIKGYNYVRSAIIIAVENPQSRHALTKVLYPAVAKEFKTTSSRVERCILHTIEHTWHSNKLEALQKYFGQSAELMKKPSNGLFISTLADRIQMEINE